MSTKQKPSTEEYYYTCDECNLSFDDYDQHIKDHHANDDVVIRTVEDETIDGEMEVEYLDAPPVTEEFLHCTDCELVFNTKKLLEFHRKTLHGPKSLEDMFIFVFDPATKKCKKLTLSVNAPADDELKKKSSIQQQFYNAFAKSPDRDRVEEREKILLAKGEEKCVKDFLIECDLCDTKFPTVGAQRMHRKVHYKRTIRSIDEVVPEGTLPSIDSTVERYFCELCQRSFDLCFKELHIASHSAQTVYCKICNRKFKNQELLDSHMKALPDHSPWIFGKRLETDPEVLKTRPHECATCGQRFHKPHEKIKHERIHSGVRPHKCEICLKTFRTNHSLVIHLRNHTDFRPYECTICNKRFKTSNNCKEHVAIHFDERNHQCKKCPKTFKTAKGLSLHKSRHDNPFPHPCPKCPRFFAHVSGVAKHLRNHDSKNKVDCPLCAAVFSRKDFLQVHLDKDHEGWNG